MVNCFVEIFGTILWPDKYKDDIFNMLCQLLWYYIQQQHDEIFW